MTENHNAERRKLIRNAATATAGMLAGGLLTAMPASAAVSPPLTFKDIPTVPILNLPFKGLKVGADVRVLNYALALEDLESDLYVQALQRLTTGGTNKVGKTIPGLGLSERQPDVAYVQEFAPVEAAHREFLRNSLESLFSGLAIKPFKYDFGIETKSREEVLALLIDVEATGAMAYLGAVPYLRTNFFTTAAAAIQGTEARHTTTLTIVQNRLFNGDNPKPVAPLASDNNGRDGTLEPDFVLAKVSPFIVK